jgi:hypothetical protein
MLLALALAATPVAETTGAAAAAVVERYYAAIRAQRYPKAYALWHGTLSYPAFRRGYAQTAWVRVTPLPPYDVEGAAGSSYAEVKVRVDARLRSGARQRFVGSYTLRRVNDVDGSTAAQRRWHIAGAHLKPVPAGA